MKTIFLLTSIAFLFLAFKERNSLMVIDKQHTDSLPPQMKKYWLVQLFSGTNRPMDKATAERIQAAHMANIGKLHSEGKLVMAGPMGFTYPNEWRGIFILDAPDSSTAASYVKTDSAFITGRLRFELSPWWTQKGAYVFK